MAGAKPRVLVVDDSVTITRIASDMLIADGFQVVAAESFEDVFADGFVRDVSVVLADIIMPGMGGIEGIMRIRTIEPEIGVVAMSAGDASIGSEQLLKAARNVGADSVLKKPFDQETLSKTIREVLKNRVKNNILIIDDSRTVCQAVAGMLPENNYIVHTTTSFEEAITSHDIVSVDVVLTDIFMPGIGGIEAIRGIKTNWPEVKVIAMSGGFDESMNSNKALSAAIKVGADGILAKPFKPDTLHKAIADALTSPPAD